MTIISFLVLIMVVMLMFFIAPLLGFISGAISAWVVECVFPQTFATFMTYAGLTVEPWQVGGMLGFLGGFFKSTSTFNQKDKG